MIPNDPDPNGLQLDPSGTADALAAMELLDRLPASDPNLSDDWLEEASLLAIVDFAERLKTAQEEERQVAPGLAVQLERHPETRARMLIDNCSDFQTWGLAEELIDRSVQAIFDADSPRSVRIARLAVAVMDHLDAVLYSEPLAADLKARTWGNLGNAYRCAGQVQAARSAFHRSHELLLEGTGDPLEEATLLGYRSSLATETGDFPSAIALLRRAAEIYRELGEDLLLARSLVKLTIPLGMSEPEQAVEVAREAETLLEPERDAELFLMARHNQVQALMDSGHPEQATMLLAASRRHYRRATSPWAQIHLAWSEARSSAALGHLDEAAAAYEVLLDESLARGRHLDGALAALELTACRIALGRTREAVALASTMAHHLRDWGAHHRAREAWGLLQKALELEQATVEMVGAVTTFFRRYWRNPNAPLAELFPGDAGPSRRN